MDQEEYNKSIFNEMLQMSTLEDCVAVHLMAKYGAKVDYHNNHPGAWRIDAKSIVEVINRYKES